MCEHDICCLYLYFLSIVFQSVIFHVEHHPHYPWFADCVTFNFFPTPSHELAYNLFNLVTVYGVPLLIILVSYSLILREVIKKTQESRGTGQHGFVGHHGNRHFHLCSRPSLKSHKTRILIHLCHILANTTQACICHFYRKQLV